MWLEIDIIRDRAYAFFWFVLLLVLKIDVCRSSLGTFLPMQKRGIFAISSAITGL